MLRAVEVDILQDSDCPGLQQDEICAGVLAGGKDSCQVKPRILLQFRIHRISRMFGYFPDSFSNISECFNRTSQLYYIELVSDYLQTNQLAMINIK